MIISRIKFRNQGSYQKNGKYKENNCSTTHLGSTDVSSKRFVIYQYHVDESRYSMTGGNSIFYHRTAVMELAWNVTGRSKILTRRSNSEIILLIFWQNKSDFLSEFQNFCQNFRFFCQNFRFFFRFFLQIIVISRYFINNLSKIFVIKTDVAND